MIQQRTISSPSAAAQPGGKRAILDVADPEYQKSKRGKSVALKPAARPIRRRRAKSAAPKAARGVKRQPLDFEARLPIKKSKFTDINANPNISGSTVNMGGIGGIGGMMGGIGGINGDDNTGAEGFNMAPNFYRTPSTETIIEEPHRGVGDGLDFEDDAQPLGAGVGLDLDDDPPTFDEASDADDEESDGDEEYAPPAYAPAAQVAAGAPQPPDDGDSGDDSSQQDESTQSDGVNRIPATESSDDEALAAMSVPAIPDAVAQAAPVRNDAAANIESPVADDATDSRDEAPASVDTIVQTLKAFTLRKVALEFQTGIPITTEASRLVQSLYDDAAPEFKEKVESHVRKQIIQDAQMAGRLISLIPSQDELVEMLCKYVKSQATPATLLSVLSKLRKVSYDILKAGSNGGDNFRNGWPGHAYDAVRRQKWLFWLLVCIFLASTAHGSYRMYSDGTWSMSWLVALASLIALLLSLAEWKLAPLEWLLKNCGKANKPADYWDLKIPGVNGAQFKKLRAAGRNERRVARIMDRHTLLGDYTIHSLPRST